MLTTLTERWVHDDAIESFLAQFDKGKATGGIFRKERIFVTFFLTQSGRKLLQRSLQTLCDFLKNSSLWWRSSVRASLAAAISARRSSESKILALRFWFTLLQFLRRYSISSLISFPS